MVNPAALQVGKHRHANLHREVLVYLETNGPIKRERFYAGFNEAPTAEIAPVLDELRQLGYVEVLLTDKLLLTASGREWLKNER